MVKIYSGPTTSAHTRTLMASYDAWKEITPRLDPQIARRIDQQISRDRKQPLIRVEFSVTEATTVLNLARSSS